jgi:hypothetical protein
MMRKIIDAHFADISGRLAQNALDAFYALRNVEGIEKKPATRELINWIRALHADPDFKSGEMLAKEIPYLGVLFKKSGDYQRVGNSLLKRGIFR